MGELGRGIQAALQGVAGGLAAFGSGMDTMQFAKEFRNSIKEVTDDKGNIVGYEPDWAALQNSAHPEKLASIFNTLSKSNYYSKVLPALGTSRQTLAEQVAAANAEAKKRDEDFKRNMAELSQQNTNKSFKFQAKGLDQQAELANKAQGGIQARFNTKEAGAKTAREYSAQQDKIKQKDTKVSEIQSRITDLLELGAQQQQQFLLDSKMPDAVKQTYASQNAEQIQQQIDALSAQLQSLGVDLPAPIKAPYLYKAPPTLWDNPYVKDIMDSGKTLLKDLVKTRSKPGAGIHIPNETVYDANGNILPLGPGSTY